MRVLIGYVIDGKFNGIDRYIITMMKYFKRFNCEFDVLTSQNNMALNDAFLGLADRIIEIPSLKHPTNQYKVITRIISECQYDVAYFNISEAFNCMGLLAAARKKIQIRVVHSHNSKAGGNSVVSHAIRTVLHYIFRPVVSKLATHKVACSTLAGKWMFRSQYKLIYNCVDYEQFKYSETISKALKLKYDLTGKIVLGHVSNYTKAKNALFLIELLNHLEDKYCMLLVGDGEDMASCKKLTAKYHLENRVLYVGKQDNPSLFYQAMDAFLLPSYFEGFPIVSIEAQMNGLPVIMSDNITKECKQIDSCYFVPLKIEKWISVIHGMDICRNDSLFNVKTEFSITKQMNELRNYIFR